MTDNPRGRNRPKARPGTASPAGEARPIDPVRRWLFRVAAAVLVPALLLVTVEFGLRLAGYGFSTSLFKPRRINGQDFLVENDEFSFRFFPPELARTPGPIRMQAAKPAGTIRIFILGESAAMGDPEPAFAAGRYLEILLRERFPGLQFEIINVAFTAINSHVILPIARECAKHEGDLWIVYMGNNEMVGPFGAATVFGAQAVPWELVRLSLAFRKTRLGQCLLAWSRKLARHSADPASWGGMQMFVRNRVAPADPRKETVYRSFRRNLQDIVQAGLDANAKVILSTVAVNLKDCPPFASTTNSALAPSALDGLKRLASEGSNLMLHHDWSEALRKYAEAAQVDPGCAEFEFREGQCWLHSGNPQNAREHFQKACDLDALPFRADSRLNRMIRELAARLARTGLTCCAAAARLESERIVGSNLGTNLPVAPQPLGNETFYEHVHLNFDGNYRLARIWAEEVERLLPPTPLHPPAADWISQGACERWLGLTDWNRATVIEAVLRRMQQPPLSDQANNAEREAGLRAWKNSLALDQADAATARAIYQQAIQRAPGDYCLYENFGDFLAATHDYQQAKVEWNRVCELVPDDYLANYRLAGVLAQQNQFPAAEAALLRAVARRPYLNDAWYELGQVRAAEGKLDAAFEAYQRARRLRPQAPETYLGEGKVLIRMNRQAEGIEHLREAIRLNPSYWEAHDTLGGQLGLSGDIDAARSEFEQVVKLKPGYPRGHLNLGVALLKQGQAGNAARQFEEAVRLDPTNDLAHSYLQQAQSAAGTKP